MMILLIFQDRFDENGVYVLNDLFEKKHCQKQIFCHKKYNNPEFPEKSGSTLTGGPTATP